MEADGKGQTIKLFYFFYSIPYHLESSQQCQYRISTKQEPHQCGTVGCREK